MNTVKGSRKTKFVTLRFAPEALARIAIEYGQSLEVATSNFDNTASIGPLAESNKARRTKWLAHQRSTSAANTSIISYERRSLMRLPPELRIYVAERVLSQHASWCLERSQSGEHLLAIWNYLTAAGKQDRYDYPTQRMIASIFHPFRIDVASSERYEYRPGVPALLQVNQALRSESVDLYLDSARVQIARHEADHELALKKHGELYKHVRGLQNGTRGRYMGPLTRAIVTKELQEHYSKMIERFLRWFILRESCILLRSGPVPV